MRRVLFYCSFALLVGFSSIYAVAVDQIVVRNVVFEGVRKLPLAEQQRIILNVQQHVNKQSDIKHVGERVLYGFQRDGFFHARVDDPIVKVVSRSGNQETIDLVMDVDEGEQYRLREIRFSGSNEFPESVLRARFPIADGEIFDRESIGRGLDALRKLFGSKGYKEFSAVPQTVEDKANRTVILFVDMQPGPGGSFDR